MDRYSRNLVLDIFDYHGHKLCNLYDNSFDVGGQAVDIYVQTDRNGWKELSFNQPAVCEGDLGAEDNYRLQYLKADFRIRLIDDSGIDWFVISEPKITHQAFTRSVSVIAGHIAQTLKTKNLDLEFSDDEGNNVGTAEQLLTTILKGSGWKPGDISSFYEKDGTTIKVRSLQASAKTGAFKQITMMCDLFDAKPVFHGDSKTVDILPMNPFSKPVNGQLPEIAEDGKVLEIHYGQNASGVSRVLNTDNMVTKLYAYGAFGDKDLGYCGIDIAEHVNHIFTLTDSIHTGTVYSFSPTNTSTCFFVPKHDVPESAQLIWSDLDRASKSYIWDEHNQAAYRAYDIDAFEAAADDIHMLPKLDLPAEQEEVKQKNWFSFLMDYSYYQNAGLFTDDMLQRLAVYQREGTLLHEASYKATSEFNDLLNKLVLEIVGTSNYCKLNPSSIDKTEGYTTIHLNTDTSILYRTDYYENEKSRFTWTPAESIDEKGDPTNDVASVIYVIHHTSPVTWSRHYIKSFNDGLTESQDGEEQNNIVSVTLWDTSGSIGVDDDIFLFELLDISAGIGAKEAMDEAIVASIENMTKVVTAKHPVYFMDVTASESPIEDAEINEYAWLWKYDSKHRTPSRMYFYMKNRNTTAMVADEMQYTGQWVPVHFTMTPPPPSEQDGPTFWYNWNDLNNYTQSTLYAQKDGKWQEATDKLINAQWEIESPDDSSQFADAVISIEDLYKLFMPIRQQCLSRDILYQGRGEYLTYEVTDSILPAGNYYVEDTYGQYYVFTTTEDLPMGSKLKYRFSGSYRCVEQHTLIDGNYVTTIIEAKDQPMDAVKYNNDSKNLIVVEKTEHYARLEPTVYEGENNGLIHLIEQFRTLSDDAYNEYLSACKQAQQSIDDLLDDTIDSLGDIYREGWWQSDEYVEGDEAKLYQDAADNLDKIAQPEATYTVNYLDRYGANTGMEFGASVITQSAAYPDVTVDYAVHLVDPEIGVNTWAYIDRLKKCYDKPWNTTQAINTNLSTMTQHTFTDVLAHIADVASQMKGKATTYDRAGFISADGTIAAERLKGAINAAKLKIFGGGSTWYTDESGNMVFESTDGSSAMTLAGGGFALADSKNEWGEWNWRTFGTGKGFSADEINTGFLSADRIQAGSISSRKLDPSIQGKLDWVEGAVIRLDDDAITATVANRLTHGGTPETDAFQASMVQQTSDRVTISFESRLSEYDAAKQLAEDSSNYFDFQEDGFYIRKKDGEGNNVYTKQTSEKYSFYNNGKEQASISSSGMSIDSVEILSQIRFGDQVGLMDSENNITWTYIPK